MIKLLFRIGLGVFALVSMSSTVPSARAEVVNNAVSVSATVLGSCSVTAGPLSYGQSRGEATRSALSNVVVTCPQGTAYSVGLHEGSAGSGDSSVFVAYSNGRSQSMSVSGGIGSDRGQVADADLPMVTVTY